MLVVSVHNTSLFLIWPKGLDGSIFIQTNFLEPDKARHNQDFFKDRGTQNKKCLISNEYTSWNEKYFIGLFTLHRPILLEYC